MWPFRSRRNRDVSALESLSRHLPSPYKLALAQDLVAEIVDPVLLEEHFDAGTRRRAGEEASLVDAGCRTAAEMLSPVDLAMAYLSRLAGVAGSGNHKESRSLVEAAMIELASVSPPGALSTGTIALTFRSRERDAEGKDMRVPLRFRI